MAVAIVRHLLFDSTQRKLFQICQISALNRLSQIPGRCSLFTFKKSTKEKLETSDPESRGKPSIPNPNKCLKRDIVIKENSVARLNPLRHKQNMKFKLQGIDLTYYTHKALDYPKTGGRGWDGRIFNRRVGGGAKQKYRMVDFTRIAMDEKTPLEERVLLVRYDPLRSADIALVASGHHKRWIIASENMKKGDLIRSFAEIPSLPVTGKEGDAHPVGALPVGSVFHNIETYPNSGGTKARAAGTCGVLLKKVEDMCIVKLPSDQEISISNKCVVTVGRVSNIEHGSTPIGSAQRNRWFGVRPKSGLFHKKTGYNGRKIKGKKKIITYDPKIKPLHEMFDE